MSNVKKEPTGLVYGQANAGMSFETKLNLSKDFEKSSEKPSISLTAENRAKVLRELEQFFEE